jgi:uncharacterized protein YijF (DUF1287 family)
MGKSLPLTKRPEDYAPGDLVTWDLGGSVPHIGIVEDVLFNTGHYRYFGPSN